MRANSLTSALGVAVIASSLLAGCMQSGVRPDAQITSAQEEIESAERAGASEYSSERLARAQNKLDEARSLAEAGKFEQALRAANEAEIDASVAAAAADAGRLQEAVGNIRRSTERLRSEIARKQGG